MDKIIWCEWIKREANPFQITRLPVPRLAYALCSLFLIINNYYCLSSPSTEVYLVSQLNKQQFFYASLPSSGCCRYFLWFIFFGINELLWFAKEIWVALWFGKFCNYCTLLSATLYYSMLYREIEEKHPYKE